MSCPYLLQKWRRDRIGFDALLLHATGLRVSELCALKSRDL